VKLYGDYLWGGGLFGCLLARQADSRYNEGGRYHDSQGNQNPSKLNGVFHDVFPFGIC